MTDSRRFSISVRVYYEDTDAGGIVYHASYLRFMERARTDWLRSFGATHDRLAREDGIQFVVSEMALRFVGPARLDELLEVDLSLTDARRASLRLAQRVLRESDGGLVADASVRVAAIDRASARPVAMPAWLLDMLGTR
jgi:acyl-CoA thioester hydrolase